MTRYHISANRWTEIDLRYVPRRHASAVVIGDRVIVVGGNTSSRGSALDIIEVFPLTNLQQAPSRRP